MNSNEHIALKIVLGTIAEYIGGGYIAVKLLDELLAWCVNHMTESMIGIGIVMIILLCIAAIFHDQRISADHEEFYEKFGGETDEE